MATPDHVGDATEYQNLPGCDRDRWVERLRHRDADVDELLALFEALRSANLALWRRTPLDERARYGMHAERGPESYELTFRLIAGHDRFHLTQARRTLDQIRQGRSRGSRAHPPIAT